MGRVLIVDDEPGLRETLTLILKRDGHDVDSVTSGEEALSFLQIHDDVQVVLSDIRMGGMTGLELLSHVRKDYHDVFFILMTAYAAWDTSTEAMRLGAFNFIAKPFDNNAVRMMVRRACDSHDHYIASLQSGEHVSPLIDLIGCSPQIQAVQRLIEQIAATDTTCLVTGRSGTGKELVSRAIHYGSMRSDGPLVRVNAGALTSTLLESELFGHVKGAFTGATHDRPGLFSLADGGTLFLDEVGELSLETQVKLLRVLESGEYIPVGGTDLCYCDVRVVTATNRDLKMMVTNETFREDLFYRLAVIAIELPPLKERIGDIPLLVGHMLARHGKRMPTASIRITEDAMRAMQGYAWPGNVRELDNRIQRALTLASGADIDVEDIFGDLAGSKTGMWRAISSTPKTTRVSLAQEETEALAPQPIQPEASLEVGVDLKEQLQRGASIDLEAEVMHYERELMEAALKKTDHNLTEAAKLLGISFRQIRYKARTLGLRR